jgi:hypothetical protein
MTYKNDINNKPNSWKNTKEILTVKDIWFIYISGTLCHQIAFTSNLYIMNYGKLFINTKYKWQLACTCCTIIVPPAG